MVDKRRSITFYNKKTGEIRVAHMKPKVSDYFFRKWWHICKTGGFTEMERSLGDKGEFSYSRTVAVPNQFKDFRLMMETL